MHHYYPRWYSAWSYDPWFYDPWYYCGYYPRWYSPYRSGVYISVGWGWGYPYYYGNYYYEPDGEVSRGFLKPFVTVVGFPFAVAWDVVTFPFQIIFGVYPYGDDFMDPETGATGDL